MLLAVAPGVVTAIVVAGLGRHDIAPQLCSAVPHHTMPNPLATIASLPTLAAVRIRGAHQSQTDYHDWVCRNIMPTYDYGVVDAMRVVANIGLAGLTVSLVFGALAFAGTMYGISGVSGVPARAFVDQLRGSMAWVIAQVEWTSPGADGDDGGVGRRVAFSVGSAVALGDLRR